MRDPKGFVLIWRKIMDSSFYTNPNTCRLATHCIFKCNYSRKMVFLDGREICIKRGQFMTGRRVLSEETGLSEQNIRTALKNLKKVGFLTIKPTSHFSIITVVKYNDYQKAEFVSNQATNQASTNSHPAINPPPTTTKELNNTINEMKETSYRKVVNIIFQYWKNVMGHNKARLTNDRFRKIQARLREGYSLKDCQNAIEGCKKSYYHMGENEEGKIHDSIDLIFRNGGKLEQFIGYFENPPQKKKEYL